MRNIALSAILILTLFTCMGYEARADENEARVQSFYIEPFAGFHTVPGFLLKFEADTYPQGGLKGHVEGLRIGHQFNDRYSLGLAFFHADVNASGPWGKNDEEKAHGVTGQALGRVDLSVYGIGIEGARRFYILDNLAVITRLGLGAGYVDVRFNGSFHGHPLGMPDYEINEPAHEHTHRIIPVVGLGASLEWRPITDLGITVGPYWNTGLGAEASLVYYFNF